MLYILYMYGMCKVVAACLLCAIAYMQVSQSLVFMKEL